METKKFNIRDWLPGHHVEPVVAEPLKEPETAENIEQDIERVICEVERTQIDLTTTYQNWMQIGFSLASELGEKGRSCFHRVSKFNASYNVDECNKKYDNFLKYESRGISIKTFFYIARREGIDIGTEKKNVTPEKRSNEKETNEEAIAEPADEFITPLLPAEIYAKLPKFLQECCDMFYEGIEKDIFLLSAITVLSGCLPNIEGVYFNRRLSAHLYLFITGPSASGKGTMIWARYLGNDIHEKLYEETKKAQEEYHSKMEDYDNVPKKQKSGIPRPDEPLRKMLYIPANSSSSALTQLLAENDFRGIIFESEADTLSNTAKQDWGDSSDIFRKAFHHENTSMARRANKEFIEIKDPHLAICLSGTPKQVTNLMPEVENGLFSRFMYYCFLDSRGFLNPFVNYQNVDYDYYFTQKSYEVFHFNDKLSKLKMPILFSLTEKQGLRFTELFQNLLFKNKMLLARDLDANTKRLGVITFRIAMVLSALRLLELPIGSKATHRLTCNDDDFNTALKIATTLESHAVAVYQQMPKIHIKGLRLTFFEKLPQTFQRADYLKIAADMGLSVATADRYMNFFKNKLIGQTSKHYAKIASDKNEDLITMRT